MWKQIAYDVGYTQRHCYLIYRQYRRRRDLLLSAEGNCLPAD
jgi:hypothetical protein